MDDIEDDDFYAPTESVQATHTPNNTNDPIPTQHQDEDMEEEEEEEDEDDDVRLQDSTK